MNRATRIRAQLRDETDPVGMPGFITRCTMPRSGHLAHDPAWWSLYTVMRKFEQCRAKNGVRV